MSGYRTGEMSKGRPNTNTVTDRKIRKVQTATLIRKIAHAWADANDHAGKTDERRCHLADGATATGSTHFFADMQGNSDFYC